MDKQKFDRLLLFGAVFCIPFTLLSFVQSVASDGDWHGWLVALIWNAITLLEMTDKHDK